MMQRWANHLDELRIGADVIPINHAAKPQPHPAHCRKRYSIPSGGDVLKETEAIKELP